MLELCDWFLFGGFGTHRCQPGCLGSCEVGGDEAAHAGVLGRDLSLLLGSLRSHGRNWDDFCSHSVCQGLTLFRPTAGDFSERMTIIMIVILISAYYMYRSGFSQRNRISKEHIKRFIARN